MPASRVMSSHRRGSLGAHLVAREEVRVVGEELLEDVLGVVAGLGHRDESVLLAEVDLPACHAVLPVGGLATQ